MKSWKLGVLAGLLYLSCPLIGIDLCLDERLILKKEEESIGSVSNVRARWERRPDKIRPAFVCNLTIKRLAPDPVRSGPKMKI